MRLLLDTHALLWFFAGDSRLNQAAIDAITDEANSVMISMVSLQEIAVKSRIGKLQIDIKGLVEWIDESAFERLYFEDEHAVEMSKLTTPSHNDPFDLMLVSQAIVEHMAFVTSDTKIIGHFPIDTLECG